MSCCGESAAKTEANAPSIAAHVTPFPSQLVTQQPGPHPGPQWPQQREKGSILPSGGGMGAPMPPPAAYHHQTYSLGSAGSWEKPYTNTYSPSPSPSPGLGHNQNQSMSMYSHGAPPPQSSPSSGSGSGSPPPGSGSSSGLGPVSGTGAYSGYGSTYGNVVQSPPPALTPERSVPMTVTSRGASPTMPPQPSFADEGKISVSIDFGTTFSGVAYGSSRIAGGKVQQILNWPGSFETFRKIPTCLLYDPAGQLLAWGIEAKSAGPMPGAVKCEWFKLFLEPQALRDASNVDPRLPALPPGKRALDVIIDFLSCLWDYAKQQITRDIGAVADLDSADVWLTVPAAWDATGCQMMRDAALAAGLVRSARAGDTEWRDRLHIISEPEAAAVHCANLTDLHKLSPNKTFMICDAGGGTVDLAVYKIIGTLAQLEIAEMCARSGANCGALFLDLRFRELVRTLLAAHPVHLDDVSLANFMEQFSEAEKARYAGRADDDKMFHFTCFNVEDADDAAVGLANGEIAIPGNLLRCEVFDPVVDQVLELIEAQAQRVGTPLDALLLVGGFAGSAYLFRRVQETFGARIRVIARPSDCDTATVRGAAQYGLARRTLVSSVVAPQSYMLKVKLPAEQEDWLKRPAYIRENDAGVPICENRLQYLVAKGAILRKGQRLKTTFCKFSQTASDRTFVATLFTSESDKIMRYTDEGEIRELCRWTIDLGALPSFQENARVPNAHGFYTEFELGLELDSAEVRGVLVYAGEDWGRVVFDYRS